MGYYLKSVLLISFISCSLGTQLLRPRGVSLIRASLYDSSKDFTCFDGSGTIPFTYVNDDYCDCRDGSDEPGTAACPNGLFHCHNIGHVAIDIRSSRVNDGICDCCDGADEWASGACEDVCLEIGRAAREEAAKREEEAKRGSILKLGMIEQGMNMRRDKETQLEQLKIELQAAEAEQLVREETKKQAEEPEAAALEKYREAQEAKKEAEKAAKIETNQEEAKRVFDELDTNSDGLVSRLEIQADTAFDTNRDGTVSDEEVDSESVDFEKFYSFSWRLMRPAYLFARRRATSASLLKDTVSDIPVPDRATFPKDRKLPDEDEESPSDNLDPAFDDEAEDGDDDSLAEEDDYDPEPYEGNGETPDEEEAAPEVVYDEETQALVNVANEARAALKESEDSVRALRSRIQDLQDSLAMNYGEREAFRPLHGECFSLDDKEYTYKLCVFDKATQTPQAGGGETRLGTWGEWVEEGGIPRSAMKYTNGQGCWNGPSRSTLVNLQCGVTNKLISASEPSKCEYVFKFVTPAACDGGDSQEAAATVPATEAPPAPAESVDATIEDQHVEL